MSGQVDHETFNGILRRMANAGSSPAELRAYAEAHGYRIASGPTDAEIGQMQHSRKPINVVSGSTSPDTPQGFEPLPADAQIEGFDALPSDAQLDQPQPDGSQGGLLHDVAVGVRGLVDGVGALADMTTNAPAALAARTTGLPSPADQRAALWGDTGAPRTDNERLIEAAAHGVGMAGPFALEGGALGALGAVAGGAASGTASEGVRQAGYGVPAQIAAGVAAGGLAGLAPTAAARTAGAFGPRVLSPLAEAFERQAVPALAADVGGVGARMGSGFANMTLGGIPLAEAAAKSVAAAKAARDRIAGAIGQPARTMEGQSDSFGAGLTAQRGVRRVLGESGSKQLAGERLYSAVPIAPGHVVELGATRAALGELTTGLTSNPALSRIWTENPRLKATLDALTDRNASFRTGQLSWADMNRFRTIVGRIIGRPSLGDDGAQIDQLRTLYGALSQDMRATAASASPKALSAFERANTYWRALETRRNEILTPLLGANLDASGADAFRHINSWVSQGGNSAALGRALRSMPADEASTVRATIFDRLGTAPKGQQDTGGQVFSPASFVTHWNNLSTRARAVLFPEASYRQDITDLVNIAGAQKGAQQYANVSRTGNVANGLALLQGFFANPLATLGVGLSEVGFGRLMASPRFARWLASAPAKPNPAAALAHVNRLGAIAGTEPAIANEVLRLQERLASAFSHVGSVAPARVAAQEPVDEAGSGAAVAQGGQGQPGNSQDQQNGAPQ